jgi:hypothetical protein
MPVSNLDCVLACVQLDASNVQYLDMLRHLIVCSNAVYIEAIIFYKRQITYSNIDRLSQT